MAPLWPADALHLVRKAWLSPPRGDHAGAGQRHGLRRAPGAYPGDLVALDGALAAVQCSPGPRSLPHSSWVIRIGSPGRLVSVWAWPQAASACSTPSASAPALVRRSGTARRLVRSNRTFGHHTPP